MGGKQEGGRGRGEGRDGKEGGGEGKGGVRGGGKERRGNEGGVPQLCRTYHLRKHIRSTITSFLNFVR